MKDKPKYTNALIDSESPYLLQHAHNPVNWQPWSEKTWAEAREQHKAVIVSIGYSTCHWCHVMERESFEDPATAARMNESFVCIKVDREERPDVDLIYMDACQLMTGRGGWPLNVICMPDKRPVYAGTYFTRESWNELLRQIAEIWRDDQAKMEEFAVKISNGVRDMNGIEFPETPVYKRSDLVKNAENIIGSFDLEQGGLDRSQKFPMPVVYEYLLDEYLISGNKHILDFVNFTLLKMANGGIYDHLRGGFCRYTVDRYWFAPHFEKMLYDNAQLVSLYSRAFAITGADIYKKIVVETIAFLQREMKMEGGGYYAALDADSEGIEGRFYVFTWKELTEILDNTELELASLIYNFSEKGNWEHGYNILHKPLSPLQLLERSGLDVFEFEKLHGTIREKLLQFQNQRIRPGLDNKVICSWNGLMLKALADAGKYLQEDTYTNEARDLANWMWNNLYDKKELIRIFTKTNAKTSAFSEDYALFIQGLTSLFEADEDVKWVNYSAELLEHLFSQFYDHETGLFVYTSLKTDALILHKTDTGDDVIPSTNSVLAVSLQKLGMLMDKPEWIKIGSKLLQPLRYQVSKNMPWYSNWGRVGQLEAIGMLQLVVIGNYEAEELNKLKKILPSWAVFVSGNVLDLPILEHKRGAGEKRIFICLNQTCFEPVVSAEQACEIVEDLLFH